MKAFTDDDLKRLKEWNAEHADKRDLIFALIARLEAAEAMIGIQDGAEWMELCEAWEKACGK